MKTLTRDVRKILLKRDLVYLGARVSGLGIKPYETYAIEINAAYPWAGSFTDKKEDATAFTKRYVRALGRSIKAWKKAGWPASVYTLTPIAPGTHKGPIVYLPKEIK
jgi:hypothetical protein